MEDLQENSLNSFSEEIAPSISQNHHHHDNNSSSFQSTYMCYPLSIIGRDNLEQGDQIIMPESALNCLMKLKVGFPMLFEIRNDNKCRVSHCGVYEFTAEEGFVFLPIWMMKNLQLQEGELVTLISTSLEKGTYVKLQPHSMDFLEIPDPKAALEECLSSKFFCLTIGDTITIEHDSKYFVTDIIDAKPTSAVCILDTDCEVEFAPPLDYKEPVKQIKEERDQEEKPFVPFSGRARRLDEKPGEELASCSVQERKQTVVADKNMANESEFRSRKRPGKLVFGSTDDKSKAKEPQKKSKTEIPEKEKFQPFIGKKYSLA